MTAERDSMTLNEVSVPALGVEDVATRPPGPAAQTDPGRRLWPSRSGASSPQSIGCILEEADRCNSPARWAASRREGLYSSQSQGLAAGVGREEDRPTQPAAKVRALEAQVARLEHELHTAPIRVQGKVAGLLGFSNTERALDRGPTACGAGRRGAGLPSTGRVTGDLLPSSEVNSREQRTPGRCVKRAQDPRCARRPAPSTVRRRRSWRRCSTKAITCAGA